MDIRKLLRKNIVELKPYRSARNDFQSGILLDANENSLGDPFDSEMELNRYPDPYQSRLRMLIADYRGVDSEQVFVGVGSDEVIDLCIRMFCEPGKDQIIVTPPTYGMYKVSAAVNNVVVRQVLLTDDFQLDVDRILKAANESTKILFLCSPNNPTGNSLNRDDIEKIIQEFPGLLVLDEAYVDFSEQGSLCNLISSYPNLLVMQTLSKAFGLAGIRLGIGLAQEDIIGYMMKVKAPYNINKLTSDAAIRAFADTDLIHERVEALLSERDRLIEELLKVDAVNKIHPTDANFFLMITKDAREVYRKLAEEGVIVRYRGDEPGCKDGLRVTVGTVEENNCLIEALNKVTV
jgi:histidinol-phosphate aminotransferase